METREKDVGGSKASGKGEGKGRKENGIRTRGREVRRRKDRKES